MRAKARSLPARLGGRAAGAGQANHVGRDVSAALMLAAEDRHELDLAPGRLQAGEHELSLEPFVVLLDEAADDGGRGAEDREIDVPPGLEAAGGLVVEERIALQDPVAPA